MLYLDFSFFSLCLPLSRLRHRVTKSLAAPPAGWVSGKRRAHVVRCLKKYILFRFGCFVLCLVLGSVTSCVLVAEIPASSWGLFFRVPHPVCFACFFQTHPPLSQSISYYRVSGSFLKGIQSCLFYRCPDKRAQSSCSVAQVTQLSIDCRPHCFILCMGCASFSIVCRVSCISCRACEPVIREQSCAHRVFNHVLAF